MTIAFDAKRYFHNGRGLGNYSRDVVRLLQEYAPEWDLKLVDRTGLSRSLGAYPECDIYHGLSGEIPYRWPLRSSRCKTIVTIHDCIYRRYPELYSPTYRWLFDHKVAYACAHADIIICISEQTRRDVLQYYHPDPRKIRVVYQGCNSQFWNTPRAGDGIVPSEGTEGYILQVGAIEERKNLKSLIRAAALLHYDGRVVAIGSQSRYAAECEALAKELGVRLEIRSDASFRDLPAWYQGAICSVYPSFFEGFGIPILESLCCGTPVITSTGSCFAETGGDAALYADPNSPEDLAEKLSSVLYDEQQRATMIQRGYEQAERFSDERVAAELIKVYLELAE